MLLKLSFRPKNLLQYCARNRLVAEGKACHGQLVRAAMWVDTLTNNMLINMYCKCGLTEIARKVFDMMSERSLVSWNTMIGAYTKNGCQDEALSLFVGMQREQHYHPLSEFTLSSVLCACAAKSAIYECKQLHAFAVKKAIDSNVYVGTALVDVYSKCNLMREALCIFEGLEDKSDVTWSSMVAGYVRNELYWEALRLYSRGQDVGLKQNQFTLSCLLSACAGLAALFQGNQLHCVLQKTGFSSSIYVSSALIDMYAKCGGIKEAYQVFSDEENKTIVSWNTMISGFSRHGRCLQVMILFEKMQQKGVFPNEVTYVSVLSACGHMGLVEEGRKYFDLMVAEKHCRSQNVLHYSCLVDILSRAGLIYDAYDVIRTMPFEATASMWGSLLGACKVAGNVELGEIAANHLFEVEPINAGNHVLLSNIYARNKKWEEVAKSRKVLKESEAIKERGRSWIESKHEVHTFMAGEMEHPQTLEIYSKLEEVMEETENLGYKVDIGEDAHDVDESTKVVLLRHHSEKLALAFGLITLPSGVPIKIIKNLRICGDCHSFMKYASKTTNREIVVRDVNRFHHFAAGYCSCGDFW